MTSSAQSFRAHPVVMLFCRFIDGKVIDTVNNELKDIVTMAFGASEYVKFNREIELVGLLLYYLSSFAKHGATVGQMFCGLQSFYVVADPNGKEYVQRNASRGKFMYAAILYALLPYLYYRRSEIVSSATTFWNMLLEPEELRPPRNDSQMDQKQETDIANEDSEEKKVTGTAETVTKSQPKRSILEVIVTTLYRSYLLISHESSMRIERLINYFHDIHMYLFARSGRYLDLPLRLMQLQLFSEALPSVSTFQVKISSFAWMIAIRIVLLSYYACCVVTNELDMQLLETSENPVSHPQETSNDIALPHLGSCPLCLDSISFPAALPCGHICCWGCITTFAFKRPSASGVMTCKCPICRQPFQQQNIRALFFS